ncbi:MAG: hypothetical protein Q611_LSC00026G0001, partial [Leuconostoc sp. DORA_2]
MKAAIINAYGGSEQLVVAEQAIPHIQQDE